IIAIGLAFVFRLNKALVLLAANISIPPMIPIILFASHWMGRIWMGKEAVTLSFDKELSYDILKDNLLQYTLGAVTLAVGAGLFFGIITYFLLLKFHKPTLTEERE